MSVNYRPQRHRVGRRLIAGLGEGYDVYSWSPGEAGEEVPSTEVHLVLPMTPRMSVRAEDFMRLRLWEVWGSYLLCGVLFTAGRRCLYLDWRNLVAGLTLGSLAVLAGNFAADRKRRS